MLVLSRRQEESIRIGEDVVVTVLSVQGNRVRLGIEAPANIGIRRSELPCLVTQTSTPPQTITNNPQCAAIQRKDFKHENHSVHQ